MSWSRMAAKTFLRLARTRGHLRLEGRLLEVAKPFELAQGRPAPSGRRGRGPCRRRDPRGPGPRPRATGRGSLRRPDRRSPGGPRRPTCAGGASPGWSRAGCCVTSVSWIVRSLFRVTRNAARSATRKPPKSASSRGPMTFSSEHEPALAVGLLGQRHEAVEHRRDLEHGIELAGGSWPIGLDPQDQVQALVVQVREGVGRVDRQRASRPGRPGCRSTSSRNAFWASVRSCGDAEANPVA